MTMVQTTSSFVIQTKLLAWPWTDTEMSVSDGWNKRGPLAVDCSSGHMRPSRLQLQDEQQVEQEVYSSWRFIGSVGVVQGSY